MSISVGLLETIRIIWAGLFMGKFLFYASGLYYYDEFKLPRFASTLVDNLAVAGLTALTYVYLLAGGDPNIRWLVYSICSSFLLRSAYTYLTCPPKLGDYQAYAVKYSNVYYAMFVSNIVTVASGYVIALMPANTWPQWLVFGLSFIPFIFVPLFLHKATNYSMARASSRSDVRWFMYVAASGWLVYPIFFVLSPIMSNVVSETTAEFAYAMADAVTKVLFGLLLAWSLRKQCGECVPCVASGMAKKDDYEMSCNTVYNATASDGSVANGRSSTIYSPIMSNASPKPKLFGYSPSVIPSKHMTT